MSKICKSKGPAIAVSLVCFIVFGYCISLYVKNSQEIWEKDERARLTRVLNHLRSNLESELYARIYYTRSVAAYVSLHPSLKNEEYYNLANELIKNDPVINTMSLAPDGVITALYPREGHEAALGLDLLDHPARRKIVEKTIETQKTFVAGPVELMEGGIAFISYTPIFDKTHKDHPFWGITDIVIKRDELFSAAGFSETGYRAKFSLRGYDGKGPEGAVFYGEPEIFDQAPVTTAVQLPDGEWVIAAIPTKGWSGYFNQDNILLAVLVIGSVIITLLFALFVDAMTRIRSNARQLNSMFNAMTASILEVSAEGEVVWVAPTRKLTPKPINELKPGDGLEAFNFTEGAGPIKEMLKTAVVDQRFNRQELQVGPRENNLWVMGNVYPKGKDHATLVFYEITEQKQQRDALKHSAEKLTKINEDKDLLFSVIAHDLRSPAAAIVGLSEALLDPDEELSTEEKRGDIELIYRSGQENLFLLENLLTWAQSQKNGLEVKKDDVPLDDIAASAVQTFKELATLKSVQIESYVEKLNVSFDPSMLETVLRNVISNALKFTEAGGKISISTRLIDETYVELAVTDQGIGMKEETLRSLNTGLSVESNTGTAHESGTGLGLPLCWRFLELNGGTMRIESKLGEGTTVYCSLMRSSS